MTTVVLNTTTRKVEVFSSARDVQARAYGHDSKSALEAATVPVGIPQLFLRGYAQAGDGGAANYKRVGAEPGHAGKIQSADGAWWEIAERLYTFKQFGAAGDGTTDDTAAINNAVSAAATTGVGRVHGSAGTYIVTTAITGQSGIHITGDGIGSTTLKRANATSAFHILSFNTASNFSIRDLTVDGNRANQTVGGHGIRLENVSEFYIGNVRVLNAYSYGIGLESSSAVAFRRGIIENVWIEGSGNDGIDIKNLDSTNEALILNNIIIVDPGMIGTGQTGLDIRGPCHLSNITVLIKTAATNVTGVRFRFGVVGVANGLGGKDSTLTNVYIKAEAGLLATVLYGIDIGHADVKITNGNIIGMNRGIIVGGDSKQCVIEGVTASGGIHGFEDQSADNIWIGCRAYNNTNEGFRINGATRPRFIGCEATGNSSGFRALNSPTKIVLIGCRSVSNTTDWDAIDNTSTAHILGALDYPFITPLTNGAGVRQAELGNIAGAVNYLRLAGNTGTFSPTLSAVGSATNLDVHFVPKGTGKVRFGAHTAIGAETLSGFIEIKDAGGTVRRVAVVS